MIFASKVKRIYPHLKGILLAAGFLWSFSSSVSSDVRVPVMYSLLGYSVVLVIFGWLHKRRFFDIDNLFFIGLFFDAVLIAAIVYFTGGYFSEFYLAFFPVIVLASVFCEKWKSLIGALWYGICYLLAVYADSPWTDNWQSVGFRIASIWSVGLVSYSVAHYMRSSEKKLLNTLDVLNERTWELESSQGQISNIYETSRVLSGILDPEQLLMEILSVAQRIFRLRVCRIFLANASGDGLYLYAGLENGNRHIYNDPVPYKKDVNDLVAKGSGFAARRGKSRTIEKQEKAMVDIPLISRGNVIGVMQVTPDSDRLPTTKDKRFLMVFASAAAVAIDNSLLHKKTEELTIIDALTGLYNFRYFRDKLADELRRADRYRQKLGVLMLDLDYFKEINDRHGHQTGNVILREVSEIISLCVRDIDIVARYGGEEFVVILPQTDEEESLAIAERIRESVEKKRFSNTQGGQEISLTISIGVAVYPDGVYNLEQLLERVDKALYRAKADGRNLVMMADKNQRRTVDLLDDKFV